MSEAPSPERERGIGSIAHLFLSQQGAPVRKGPLREVSKEAETNREQPVAGEGGDVIPTGRQSTPPADEFYRGEVGEKIMGKDAEQRIRPVEKYGEGLSEVRRRLWGNGRLSGLLLLTGHLGNGREQAEHFARQWAGKNARVGLVSLDAEQAELTEYVGEIDEGYSVVDSEWQELFGQIENTIGGENRSVPGGRADSLIPTLEVMSERVDTLLINIGKDERGKISELINKCRHLVVFTSAERGEMVGAYKTIKRLSPAAWEDKDISLFVCGAADEGAARRVYDKLAKTAWEFLTLDLKWSGWEQPPGEVNERQLVCVGDGADVVGELGEYLAVGVGVRRKEEEDIPVNLGRERDRGEGERECGRGGELKPRTDIEKEVCGRGTKREEARMGEIESVRVLCPIAVDKLPSNDVELSDALQLSLPVSLVAVGAVLAVPISPGGDIDKSVRVLIDVKGRLHVLAGSLTGSAEVLVRSLTGRQWVRDNLGLIISHFGQLKIDRSLEVGIILVTGGSVEGLRGSCGQITEFPWMVLQLQLLQNELGSSFLVV